MNANKMKLAILRAWLCLTLAGIGALAQEQPPPAAKQNALVSAKLIYVAPMDNGLDQWMSDLLQHWGKYKVTSNPEGVDLVIQAVKPEKELQLETRAGTAQPKGADRPHLPNSKAKSDEVPPLSISVIEWVTNQPVWSADIMDRKQKKDEADLPAGPQTKIFARGMTSDQLAQKVVAKLKEYEEGLEKPAGRKD
jgi:hypothetical protein